MPMYNTEEFINYESEKDPTPYCHCGCRAELKNAQFVYGPGHDYGNLWVCGNYPSCNSYVGCHKGTNNPLGTLADAELRELRKEAHALFDPLWKEKKIHKIDPSFTPGINARKKAYGWLSDQMFIEQRNCHFSQMSKQQLRKAIRILTAL